MSSLPWIKLYGEFLYDVRVGRLPDLVKLRFLQLLLLAGECDADGDLAQSGRPLSVADLAWYLRTPVKTLAPQLQRLVESGMLAFEDGVYQVVNFATRQQRPQRPQGSQRPQRQPLPQEAQRQAWREQKRRQRAREQPANAAGAAYLPPKPARPVAWLERVAGSGQATGSERDAWPERAAGSGRATGSERDAWLERVAGSGRAKGLDRDAWLERDVESERAAGSGQAAWPERDAGLRSSVESQVLAAQECVEKPHPDQGWETIEAPELLEEPRSLEEWERFAAPESDENWVRSAQWEPAADQEPTSGLPVTGPEPVEDWEEFAAPEPFAQPYPLEAAHPAARAHPPARSQAQDSPTPLAAHLSALSMSMSAPARTAPSAPVRVPDRDQEKEKEPDKMRERGRRREREREREKAREKAQDREAQEGRKGLHDPSVQTAPSPAVIYRTLTQQSLSALQTRQLERDIGDPEKWRAALEHWLNHGWNPRNLNGMLDLYQRGGASGCRYCAKASPDSIHDVFEKLRLERQRNGIV